MAPPAVTQPSFTLVNCDPADMAAKTGLAIVPADLLSSTSSPDHIVAIAVGVGIPGGILLITILVFIVVIYLNVRHRRSQDDCETGAKKGRNSPDSGAPDRIIPFSHLASSLSWRISSPQPFASRPFTHTPNRSFSSRASLSVPPSYHSTDENHDGPPQSTNGDSAVAEASEESAADDPPPSRLISLSPTSINSKLSSPAPSATTFLDHPSPSNL